ncbi:phospholipid phosphatase-related protein type 5-like isoform X2 [Melanotaenia boesemani]|uniref:phospholipid phosphatase-related protein type 5-like isoform X2 n=1 Tax=Melanotaenia boesemani TaxID=1250792 RepID=UPI001C03CFB2|nr:phospholipid phosphatase-related protein type 5-like isoform X2 [Melanotaenia boesemani]
MVLFSRIPKNSFVGVVRSDFSTMLYFQVMILTVTLMLVYYCEFTDVFSPTQQGFVCRDPALSKPDPGPEQDSRVQPVILCSVVCGLPVVLISSVELVIFLLHSSSNNLYDHEKIVLMGDCCYLNPMVRRTSSFLGVYVFGLFTTDIFINAGQLVTGSLAPYFLSVCQPNYTALGCQDTVHFVSQSDACTGNPDNIMRARMTFPCKEAAVSLYVAVYLAMYVMSCAGSCGGLLPSPLLSLSLVSLATLTGINRVAEYRNYWSDVIAGQIIGAAVAVFLVVFVVHQFKMRPGIFPVSPSDAGTVNTDEAPAQMNPTMENNNKCVKSESSVSFTEVT